MVLLLLCWSWWDISHKETIPKFFTILRLDYRFLWTLGRVESVVYIKE